MENEILGFIAENNVISNDLISKIATENFLQDIEAELENRKIEQTQLLTVSEKPINLTEENQIVIDRNLNITYDIYGMKQYEMAVIGTYIDPRISVGFRYQVRQMRNNKLVFNRPLILKSIGQGYGKRLTFEPSSLNKNDNVFWSDSQKEGFAFSINIINTDDLFQIRAKNSKRKIGILTITEVNEEQIEKSTTFEDNRVKKKVLVSGKCLVHFKNNSSANLQLDSANEMKFSGTAFAEVAKSSKIVKINKIAEVELMGVFTKKIVRLTPLKPQ
ncbi:DgyrCDS6119 [Dimorphilus gyrociliatus]|uniref:DgyrCDS6119 n=1 Tax=Dimorphilus gyrociliatus TaxID=2664684 RepID=A0A7I8VM81_9ANNE|nr:DgyrCDS6119 [Dimorphilus gyrociliatus]